MKILLLGANGQVGWELQRSLSPLGQIKACDRDEIDLEKPDDLRALVREYSPKLIVNAAAYTAVDKAESEVDKAYRVNAQAVGLLADEAKKLDAWLVHYSTDYIFDGNKKGLYTEEDETNPQSVYGKTKLQGEDAIMKSDCKYLIFRTSWVYAARGDNFAKTMIKLAKNLNELRVVSDQIGAPTSAELIADITSLCLFRVLQDEVKAQNIIGVYNLTPTGYTSWHKFAQFVIAEVQKLGVTFSVSPENILPINTSEYPLPAKRPANSRLNTDKLRNTFGIYLPSWKLHVNRLIKELY